VPGEARAFVDTVIPAQEALREVVDELETVVADDLWPLPKYRELLFQY
jgi:glutamine synthetase